MSDSEKRTAWLHRPPQKTKGNSQRRHLTAMSDGDEMPAVESIYVHPKAEPPRCAKCSRVEMLLAKIDDKRQHCVSFDLVPTLDRLRWLGDVDEATRANVTRDDLDAALDYSRGAPE